MQLVFTIMLNYPCSETFKLLGSTQRYTVRDQGARTLGGSGLGKNVNSATSSTSVNRGPQCAREEVLDGRCSGTLSIASSYEER